MRFVTMILVAMAVAAGPASKPADDAESLRNHIAELDKESAALRAQLAAITAPKAGHEIKSCPQILDEIPKEERPANRERWIGIRVKLAEEWVQKNVPGWTFNGRLIYQSSSLDADGKIYSTFNGDRLGSNTDAVVIVEYADNDAHRFPEPFHGDVVLVRGTISKAYVRAREAGGNPVVILQIKDADPPRSVPKEPPAPFSPPADDGEAGVSPKSVPKEPAAPLPEAQTTPRPRVWEATRTFGDIGDVGSVVFICNASGSMINKMAMVKGELNKAVVNLKPAQSFDMIFFHDVKGERSQPALVPANTENKRKFQTYLEKVTSGGTGDPIPTLVAVFKLKPQLIYLLTDADHVPDPEVIKKLNSDMKTRINTILLVGNAEKNAHSEGLLKKIAADSRGNYRWVEMDAIR
jgi:hypothetical protein